MKRVDRNFKPKEYHHIQFLLCNTKSTAHISEFNGEYSGECLITDCKQNKDWVGQTFQIFIKNICSYSTCFKYEARNAYQNKTGGAIVIGKAEFVKAIDMKKKFTHADMATVFTELTKVKRIKDVVRARQVLTALLNNKGFVTKNDIDAQPGLTSHLNAYSDLNRLMIIQDICTHFSKPKQRVIIRKMSMSMLQKLSTAIQTEPWMLLFKQYTKQSYSKLKPIAMKTYETIVKERRVNVPRHIGIAITIYRLYTEDAKQYNHTIFRWSEHGMRLTRGRQDADLIVEFLEQYAFTWFDIEKTLLTAKTDMDDAKRVFQFLLRCQQLATRMVPSVRGTLVPVIPQVLTGAQIDIANHIIQNCVTVVEGGPGVGKTSIITWAMSHFKKVLLCTFTGMMTKSLQLRCGQRRECAHTIHSLIYAAFTPLGRAWLSEFDVLVIDEFSNVSTNLLAKLVTVLPNIVRIVFVGDYEQLRSMEKGDPLGDIRRVFPPKTLTEILRVQPDLVDLATAPRMIVEGRFREIVFSDRGSLSFVKKRSHYSYKETLQPIWRQIGRADLLSFHIICITNDVRHSINKYSQEILIEEGILKQPRNGGGIRFGAHEFFPGVKITFSKNYNKDVVYTCRRTGTKYKSMSVANGELAVIKSIERIAVGIFFIRLTDEKTVIVSRKVEGAVDQNDIDLGYASTTTKVQGKEFACVAYWHSTHPILCWSRAHPYVAISRGKQKSWVICLERREFDTICSIVEPERKTVLSTIFQKYSAELYEHTALCKRASAIVPLNTLQLMPKGQPCVPIYEVAAVESVNDDDLDDEDGW